MSVLKKALYIKDVPSKGKGLFTKINVPKGKVIIEFQGSIVDRSSLTFPYENIPKVQNLKQIAKDQYLSISGDMDDYINHSCNPNCSFMIRGARAFLEALYDIAPDTELTFDYSITSTDTLDEWKMNCSCGTYGCRKIISGYSYLSDSKKSEYEKLNIVPKYVKA